MDDGRIEMNALNKIVLCCIDGRKSSFGVTDRSRRSSRIKPFTNTIVTFVNGIEVYENNSPSLGHAILDLVDR